MITGLIRWCAGNRVLVLMVATALVAGGWWSARTITVDAIPDLSDVQVIVRTEYPGQAPELVEDQVTYPLATAMLAVPEAETVRAFSMFGDSFLYIIFDDGIDPYWARSRVLEQLATVGDDLPPGVTPTLGPDATGVGWVYQYLLVTGPYSPDHPDGLWYHEPSDAWFADRSQAPPGSELRRVFTTAETRWVHPSTGQSYARPGLAPEYQRDALQPFTSRRALNEDPLTGTPLVDADVDLSELRTLQDWYLRFELTAVDGVSEVASIGGFVKEYQVTVDPLQLIAHDVTLQQVAAAIRDAGMESGGRTIERGEFQYLVRSRGYLGDRLEAADTTGASTSAADLLQQRRERTRRSLEDLRTTAVTVDAATGTPVRIGDVATVATGPELRVGVADWNGQGDAVGGIVVMRQGENARVVIERVQDRLTDLRLGLPPGVDAITAYDRSDLIDRSVATLTHTLIDEILTVSLVVFAFLLHARSALVAVIVLPTGVLGSLILMRVLGVNANIMSLGGIAIAIGVMVDSSIVMVENAHRALVGDNGADGNDAAGLTTGERDDAPTVTDDDPPPSERAQEERSRFAVIREAACEVGPTLFASLLLITVSFLPVFVLSGQSGRLFTPLAATKTISMAVAAVLSVTLIPVLMTMLIRERGLPQHWSPTVRLLTWILALLPAVALVLFPVPHGWLWALGALALALILLLPQRLHDEDRHPLSRWLRAAYEPVFRASLGYPKSVCLAAVAVVAVTWLPWERLGTEFMPPLEEGDFLYMPNTDPGLSITKARELLRQTDALIAQFPEVDQVMGKIGRSTTATDPAPLTMIETTIMLERDKSQWRQVPDRDWFGLVETTRPITLEELTDGYRGPDGKWVPGINEVLQIPGLTGALTRGAMPIRTRLDMLATGIRTPVGIKVMGDDLTTLDELSGEVAAILATAPETRALTKSTSTDRLGGGRYLDIVPDRDAIARHGARIADVQATVASALGGREVAVAIEGRERYGINLRYQTELRDDTQRLKEVLVATPAGRQIPLGQLARFHERFGPAMIRSENARLSNWVYVTPVGEDIGGYVDQARLVLERDLDLPAGYSLKYSGTFEQIADANQRLAIAIPLTLLLILAILYLHTRSWAKTALVVGALTFSAVGAIWLVFLLGFNWSLAVSVGLIALLGLDAETSLVMLHYQDASLARFHREGRLKTLNDLWQAIHDGAVQRIRPKTMTVITTVAGLLPLMWATGAGADTMSRLAAPMIGGLGTSFIMELVVFPAAYFLIMRRRFDRDT